jgi:hypothetical protein
MMPIFISPCIFQTPLAATANPVALVGNALSNGSPVAKKTVIALPLWLLEKSMKIPAMVKDGWMDGLYYEAATPVVHNSGSKTLTTRHH